MFGRGALDGEATIVDRRVKSKSGDGMVSIYEYVADVRVPGEQLYRCVMQEPRVGIHFWPPAIGAVVRVHAHPGKQTASFDKDDPQLNSKLRLQSDEQRFTRNARGVPGSPPSVEDPSH
jgi:hypothetical protein